MALVDFNASGMAVATDHITYAETDDLVSEELRRIFHWVVYGVVCQLIDIFGTVTNIINIICFVKQGFNDSVNVSLLGLAISDLGCVATLIFLNIFFNPMFEDSSVNFDALDVGYLITGWPHVIFARVTSWITALITIERCLCITMPLKVKVIITPRRVTIAIVSLYIIIIGTVSPVYYANRIGWKFSAQRNRSILGLLPSYHKAEVEKFSYLINNMLVPFMAFIVVIVSTSVLIINLRIKTKWREKSTGAEQAQATTNRDKKVTKMVLLISTAFIISFVPLCVICLTSVTVPGFHVTARYRNTVMVVVSFALLFESTNSAMNIFIYYSMSSNYREVFRQLFKLASQSGHKTPQTTSSTPRARISLRIS